MTDIASKWGYDWSRTNPVLRRGQPGYDKSSGRMKIGDGRTPWNDLNYLIGGSPFPAVTKAHLTSDVERAFIGVLATLERGYRSSAIGMISDSTGDDKNAGVPVDEWPRVFFRKLAAANSKYTAVEENWNDALQGYDPGVVLQNGTGNGGGERGVRFVKATPGSMQYPGTNAPTAALDVQVRITPTAWTDTADRTLECKWESGTNQRSFIFLLNANGSLGLNHSATGAAAFGQKNSTVTIPAAINPTPPALWVRATLQLDNGASGHDVKFYTSTDGVTWTQLGATVTTAGVTTLFGGTAPFQVGALGGGVTTPYGGVINKVRTFGTIGGTQSLVPPLLDDWDNYATTSEKLTFVGAPVLTLFNGGQSGQNVAYFDNATRRQIIHQPHGQQVIMVSSSHNDGTQTQQNWLGNYGAMINNIKALRPGVPILCLSQNKTGPGGTFNLTPQDVEHRATRGAMIQQWAASQGGVYSFDAWPFTEASDTIDQLHPTTGPNSGSDKWGTALFEQLS